MSKQNEKAGDPGQPGTSETKEPRPEDRSGADMKRGMAQMMAMCGCGPDMRAQMTRQMGCCGPAESTRSDAAKP